MKLIAFGIKGKPKFQFIIFLGYWKDTFNCFDGIIVITSIMEMFLISGDEESGSGEGGDSAGGSSGGGETNAAI